MRNLTKMLAFGGVILAVFLMTIVRSNAAPGAAQPTKTAIVPRITATLPPLTQTVHPTFALSPGERLPQCTFPLSDALAGETDAPGLQSYVFSEPQVVLTNKLDLRIVQWISDEEVLILNSLKPGRVTESIEILNVKNRESKKIGEGKFAATLLWSSTQKALAYLRYDETEKKWNLIWQKVGDRANQLESGVRLPILLAAGGRGAIAYSISQEKLAGVELLPTGQKNIQFAFGPYKVPFPTPYEWVYETVVSPNDRWQAVFNIEHFLLFDSRNGQITELSLGERRELGNLWVLDAQWNPDGKRLAVKVTAGRLPNPYSSLLILDIENKCSWEISISRPFYVYDMAWSPGGRYLLVSGEIGTTRAGYPIIEYRLLDLATGQERRVNLWNAEVGGIYFDWSPDGKTIIINCATPERGALCTITVEVEQ